MRKPRSRLLDYLVYVMVRFCGSVLQIVPLELAEACVRGLGRLIYRLDRRHRDVACDNLRHAFPGKYSEAELDRLVRNVFEHFAVMLLEVALMPRKLGPNGLRHCAFSEEWNKLRDVHATGRPILVVTGHFGNWELAASLVGSFGIKAHLIARPLDNPYLDKGITKLRERNGHRVLSKNGSAKVMWEILEANGALCTLADQDAGHGGMFVDFFGRPASTHKGIALMALRTNAIIVVCGLRNLGGVFKYAAHGTDFIFPEEYADRLDAVRAITQRMTTAIERLVLLDPRQYFWLHRRWKHQPLIQNAQAA